jgi:5-(aminomethyl)-3-furanmethanol phosphate kinase
VSEAVPRPVIDVVVKVGGGVLRRDGSRAPVLHALGAAAGRGRVLVVPGGGWFADAVREIDREISLGSDAAHWMAVLGMEQCAHLLASGIADAELVDGPEDAVATLDAGRLPVLAPYRWLRAADPLPHSWEVTSDSIAAWVAGAVGARRLVLIKPVPCAADTRLADLVDGHLARALPRSVEAHVIGVDELSRLAGLLSGDR